LDNGYLRAYVEGDGRKDAIIVRRYSMARETAKLLDTADTFPNLDFNLISGERILFPQDMGKRWRILLVYRGHW